MRKPQQGLDCTRPCVTRGQFDAGCACEWERGTYELHDLMDRNPHTIVYGRLRSIDKWYPMTILPYRQAMQYMQEDPMNRKLEVK
jgi:hypothetical protein